MYKIMRQMRELSDSKVLTYPEQIRVAPQKIVLRTLLICLVLPAVFTNKSRALHDHFTDSQSVRELY
jgi:hypothetical protein